MKNNRVKRQDFVINIRVSEQLMEEFKALADIKGMSYSELIRFLMLREIEKEIDKIKD